MTEIADEHPELFHYTTWSGLEGILRTQTIWATHALFLSDRAEIVAFKDRLPELLRPAVSRGVESLAHIPANRRLLQRHGGEESVVDQVAHDVVQGMYAALLGNATSAPYIDPYVVSFCTSPSERVAGHGLLSQWRSYGPDGGYAIVFDTSRLSSVITIEAKKWTWDLFGGDVVYSADPPDRFQKEFGDAIETIQSGVTEFFRSAGSNLAALDPIYHALIFCACRFKHWGFAEEQEVRVIAIPSNSEIIAESRRRNLPTVEKPIKYFLRGGTSVPCIHLFEGNTSIPDNPLPITRIIVGPHPEKEHRREAVEMLLRRLGLQASVSVSEIPYAARD